MVPCSDADRLRQIRSLNFEKLQLKNKALIVIDQGLKKVLFQLKYFVCLSVNLIFSITYLCDTLKKSKEINNVCLNVKLLIIFRCIFFSKNSKSDHPNFTLQIFVK